MNRKPLENFLAKLALSASQADLPPNADGFAPSKRQLEQLQGGALNEAEREKLCSWLIQHPEAYEQWLTQQTEKPSRSAWWAKLLLPKPLVLASLSVAVLLVSVVYWLPNYQQPNAAAQLATIYQSMPESVSEQAEGFYIQWQFASQSYGFASDAEGAHRLAFTQGVETTAQALLSGAPTVDLQANDWYMLGQANVLASLLAKSDPAVDVNWQDVKQLLQSLTLSEAPSGVEGVLAHVESLQTQDTLRQRRKLQRALEEQRQLLAVKLK